jgi:hypothetical protein
MAHALAAVTMVGVRGGMVPEFDLVLTGGLTVDDTGAPAVAGSVGITGDRIAVIGELPSNLAAVRGRARHFADRVQYRIAGTRVVGAAQYDGSA